MLFLLIVRVHAQLILLRRKVPLDLTNILLERSGQNFFALISAHLILVRVNFCDSEAIEVLDRRDFCCESGSPPIGTLWTRARFAQFSALLLLCTVEALGWKLLDLRFLFGERMPIIELKLHR